jgi:protein ImuA
MNVAAVPAALDALLEHPGIWRRSAAVQQHVRALSTGLAGLDALLPGGGWPCGALSEILFADDGIGELGLLMPALAGLTQRRQRVVFVAPPYIPYAPALAAHGLDLRYVVQIESTANAGAWSAEQCLRSGSCGAVLGWLQQADYTRLRRLQLAAESGDALAFLFRPASAAGKPSPAALRLRLHAGCDDDDSHTDAGSVGIEVLKCRGNLDWQRPGRFQWSRSQPP